MGRIYAGTLGTLAMAIVICRGVVNSSGVVGTLGAATASLFVFAVVGAVVGHIAQATIDQSVQSKLEHQLATQVASGSKATTT